MSDVDLVSAAQAWRHHLQASASAYGRLNDAMRRRLDACRQMRKEQAQRERDRKRGKAPDTPNLWWASGHISVGDNSDPWQQHNNDPNRGGHDSGSGLPPDGHGGGGSSGSGGSGAGSGGGSAPPGFGNGSGGGYGNGTGGYGNGTGGYGNGTQGSGSGNGSNQGGPYPYPYPGGGG